MTPASLKAELIDAYGADAVSVVVELAPRCLAADPEDRSTHLIYGDALVRLGRFAEAESVLERALALSNPENQVSALRLLGQLHEAQGSTDRAEMCYRQAIESAPNHASAYIYCGALLAKAGRLEQAEALHLNATTCTAGDLRPRQSITCTSGTNAGILGA